MGETLAAGNPKLAAALQSVAEALNASRAQPLEARNRFFRNLAAEWHPDKHAASPDDSEAVATKVFQWLQVVKPWYLDGGGRDDASRTAESLPADSDRPVIPRGAQQI